MSNITYWYSNGKHQAAYEELSKIVPSSGPAGTIEGEMLRAATRLYYDYYNNGFCNNTSGAVNYLMRCDELFNLGIAEELNIVEPECNTLYYTTEPLAEPLETITNVVIEYLISKDGLYTESGDNLFDYADLDAEDDEDLYDDVDDEYLWETDDVLADLEYDELKFQD